MPTASSFAQHLLRKARRQAQAIGDGAYPHRLAFSQALTVAAMNRASLPGAGYGQFEHKADSLIAKFKEAGGTVREIDV